MQINNHGFKEVFMIPLDKLKEVMIATGQSFEELSISLAKLGAIIDGTVILNMEDIPKIQPYTTIKNLRKEACKSGWGFKEKLKPGCKFIKRLYWHRIRSRLW